MQTIQYPNKPTTDSFLLDVPYNTQVDNSANKGQGVGARQCNLTCAAMLAKYFKPSLWTNYVDFANGMQDVLAITGGDTTDHAAITRALDYLGIKSYFTYTASLNDLAHSLFNGCPVIGGTKYKSSGHMVLYCGRTPDKVFSHNPYGLRNGVSDSWIQVGGNAGEDEELSYNWLKQCFVDLGPESGWARFVTSVDGVATGVKSGL